MYDICTDEIKDKKSLSELFEKNNLSKYYVEQLAEKILSASMDKDTTTPSAEIVKNVNNFLLEVHSLRNNEDQVKILLEAGADPHGTSIYKINLNERHPIYHAILNGNLNMLESLFNHLTDTLPYNFVKYIKEIIRDKWGKKVADDLANRIILHDKSHNRSKLNRLLPFWSGNEDHLQEITEIIESGKLSDLDQFFKLNIRLNEKLFRKNAEGLRKLIKNKWNNKNRSKEIEDALKIVENSLKTSECFETQFVGTQNQEDSDDDEYVSDLMLGSS